MNQKLLILTIVLGGFLMGLVFNNTAISAETKFKVAVVDAQKVVSESAQVKALREQQKKKIAELTEFVKKARTDVENEKNEKKKKELENKYNKELRAKKEKIDKEYAKELAKIDKNISSVIKKNAKAKGYDLVLTKGAVLYGGTDITKAIAKDVK